MILINSENKILIVDDNFINRKILHKLFTDLGVTVDDAQNAKDAFAKASNDNYRLLCIDYNLQSMPQFELIKMIQNVTKNQNQNKIIITSTDPNNVSKDDISTYQISEVLKKPYQMSDLEQLLMKYFVQSDESLQEPVFNIKEFINIYESKDMQKEIIQAMLDEKDSDLARMIDAFQTKNMDLIYKAMHYMKGSFSYLKATRVLTLTQKLLDAAKDSKVDEVFNLKDAILQNYELLLMELENYKDKITS